MTQTEYEELPGWLFHRGVHFACECGNKDFKVEKNTDPLRFWCTCGEYYTEERVNSLRDEPVDGE